MADPEGALQEPLLNSEGNAQQPLTQDSATGLQPLAPAALMQGKASGFSGSPHQAVVLQQRPLCPHMAHMVAATATTNCWMIVPKCIPHSDTMS